LDVGVGGESTVKCPNNVSFRLGTNSSGDTFYVQFMAFVGGISGYFYAPDLSYGLNELNGKLYMDAAYAQLLGQGIEEAQRAAIAQKLSQLTGMSYADAYNSLTPPINPSAETIMSR
jgi:hypothetical protein